MTRKPAFPASEQDLDDEEEADDAMEVDADIPADDEEQQVIDTLDG